VTLGQKPPFWVELSFNISLEGSQILELISGVMLVSSVINIHRFFVAADARKSINTRMLLRHASAFVLYMLGNFARATALGYWVWIPTDQNYSYVQASGIFLNVSSLIS
jgi:hypothetical protein